MTDAINPAPPRVRIQSVDILRGLVIVLMALDHTRDYFHLSGYALDPINPDQSNPILYITRWVTHFCAPTFVFLAGVSAWLQFEQGKSRAALSRFLLTRGLWLVFLEITVVSFGWAFAAPWMFFLQVIWAIGWSMVLLGALIWLPRLWVLAIGIVIIAGHNAVSSIPPERFGAFATLYQYAFTPAIVQVGEQPIGFNPYPVIPWLGIMAAGYGAGALFTMEKNARWFYALGAGLIALFFALRFVNMYGDPQPWSVRGDDARTIMSFFNVAKYPPSLMYVCATLGPMLMLVPLFERLKGPLADWFKTYGAVPLFAYVLHIYLVHALSLAAAAATGRDLDFQFNFIQNIFVAPQLFDGWGFPLYVTYLAWALVLAILYPLCRWWGTMKKRHRSWWMSYL